MFLIAKMSQDFVYDVLVFYTCYDSDGTTAAAANLNVDPNADRLKTRLSRWAQVMAA